MTLYVGIDPGAKGGIACLLGDKSPDYLGTLSGPGILAMQLRPIIARGLPAVAVERVHAHPHDGVVSAFSFGQRYGEILGVLEALGIVPLLVEPRAWKSLILGALPPGRKMQKAASIQFCKKTWPEVNMVPPGRRVAHDGVADALCIAEYARRRGEGK